MANDTPTPGTSTVHLNFGRGPEAFDWPTSMRVTIDVDPGDLGRHIAGMPSDQQAQVILGFYEEVSDMQLAYIGAESAFDDNGGDGCRIRIPELRGDVARVLHDLAAHIEKGE